MYRVDAVGPVTAGRGIVQTLGVRLRVWIYAVDGLLIDTGPRTLGPYFRAWLDQLPALTQVVLTHLHEDHSGMAAYIARERRVPIYCLKPEGLAGGRPVRLPLYRRVFWGTPEPFVAQPLGAVVETERFLFHVLHTPGHAPDHVVLHEPRQGWLFSGDLFLGTRIAPIMRDESLPVLMESLRRVLALPFDSVFCAHAGPVPDGRAALERKLAMLAEVQGRVRELAQRGWTVRQVTRHLFPKEPPITWWSLGEYSMANVVRSLWPREGRPPGAAPVGAGGGPPAGQEPGSGEIRPRGAGPPTAPRHGPG